MLRLYMRDYEGVAARVALREDGEALFIRMLKPPPADPNADGDGGGGGGKKGKAGKKKKEPPMSPAVVEGVKQAAGCISLLTSLGFHKEITSSLPAPEVTDQLDKLQESDDEMTRRYAREALWNLKFFEVPSSVTNHFKLTEDETGEIIVSPNPKTNRTTGSVEAGGEGGGEGGEKRVSTLAFRKAYQTPASARNAYLASVKESSGLSMSNMLRTELIPVDVITGNLGPAELTATGSQSLVLSRPGAMDEAYGNDPEGRYD